MCFYSLSPSLKDDFSFCERYCFLQLILMNGKNGAFNYFGVFIFIPLNAMIDGKRLNQFCNVLEESFVSDVYQRSR